MPPDGEVGADLILGPAQGLFHLFIALLDPHTEPVEPDHFGDGRWRMRMLCASTWRGEIRHELPCGCFR